MKKVIIVLVLIMSFLCTAQAGYIKKYITASDLTNYTLAFDGNGDPVAAATMPSFIPGSQSIVIVRANTTNALVFNVPGDVHIEVRDFHYVNDNLYILCGAHGTRAFVATMNGTFTSMQFMEYSEANIFYSIWGGSPATLDYYVCGKKGDDGVIASVDRSSLNLTGLYQTDKWEYHKIIQQGNSSHFIVSGRNLACTQIGCTEFTAPAAPVNNYYWKQNTDPASHCVVSMYMIDEAILASSRQNIVTLTTVTVGPGAPSVPFSYHFTLSSSIMDRYCVQDISTIEDDEIHNIRISVAGYMIRGAVPSQHEAWYGEVIGLSATNTMNNNHYYGSNIDRYEHYKVKYHNGVTYTGGLVYDHYLQSVLFATPRKPGCDNRYEAPSSRTLYQMSSMPVYSVLYFEHQLSSFPGEEYPISHDVCLPFKGEEPALKSVMSAENESEITTSYDRITLKDIPANTGYQIYTIQGQLVQTGTTTPDISTANLSKGVYILRLESGKTFKFVK